MVLTWASLLKYSDDGVVDADPGVTYLELAASFEISMGVPLPSRVGQSSKSGKALAWKPFDTTFGVEDNWADIRPLFCVAPVYSLRASSHGPCFRVIVLP